MIWGSKKNAEFYDESTMKEWIRFSRANLIEEFKTHLSLVGCSNTFETNLILQQI